ncbi:MAG: double-strand break repair protein AddB, partial [Pseudomonadota bacterium]
MTQVPRVFSIPPAAPFLPTLVDALVQGQLIEGFCPLDDPLALSTATIWVPTRRAARALITAFSQRLEPKGILLPMIRTLGDADDDDLAGNADPSFETAIDPIERQILLSQMIYAWSDTMNAASRSLFQGSEVLVPSSKSDALWFAADLARLIDTVATEGTDWAALKTIVPEDYGGWWELTLEFLKIATETWPKVLGERQAQDGATLRVEQLRQQAKRYAEEGSAGPVIAAGSTGSIPATANLLKTIANLPNGAVILPGLDRDLEEETWQKVDLPERGHDDVSAAQGHPQFGLKRLLEHFGCSRGDVVHLGGMDDTSAGYARVRELLISEAMRPAHATDRWLARVSAFSEDQRAQALGSVAVMEAENERAEALVIAVALRDTLAKPDATAALVTPDRNLARRVAVELTRFGIDVDDSAGQPLANRSVTALVRFIAQMAFEPADPVALASFIKHPLVRFGLSKPQAARAGQLIEVAVIRGALVPPSPDGLRVLVAEVQAQAHLEIERQTGETPVVRSSGGGSRLPKVITSFSVQDWQAAEHIAKTIERLFAGSGRESSMGNEELPLDDLVQQVLSILDTVCTDADGTIIRSHAGLDGDSDQAEEDTVLRETLASIAKGGSTMMIRPADFRACFDALIAAPTVRKRTQGMPRVAILGPIEARLQNYDRIVLGGLSDGVWPASPSGDPFLSRPMKIALGLPAPERRIGLAAHDFQMLSGVEDLVLSRSHRVEDTPLLPSRWLQRLEMIAGENTSKAMKARGTRFLSWARQMDAPSGSPATINRPQPMPPVHVRPKRLSVTEIETWIADPYAIYAKHVLKLQPLEPLIRQPDAREKGVLYHRVMEDFVIHRLDVTARTAFDDHLQVAKYAFDAEELADDVMTVWLHRFSDALKPYLEWQAERVPTTRAIEVELFGR